MMFSIPPPPVEHPHLQDNDVHIWKCSLDLPEKLLQLMEATFSEDETERKGRYHFSRDRNYFIAARGILRTILSLYLQVNPHKIAFSYTSKGKPFLPNSVDGKNLCFNLSHSRDQALYAFSFDRKIGVDIEYMSQRFKWSNIAEKIFSAEEIYALQQFPEKIRWQQYYASWTRKEAFLKSIGTGLSSDPKDITVARKSESADWTVRKNQFTGVSEKWSIHDLEIPHARYAASLVVGGKLFKIKDYSFIDQLPSQWHL